MARFCLFLLLVTLPGCTQLYYKAQEKIGNEKRDILVDRIKKGREDQDKAKEQFKSTMEAFQAATCRSAPARCRPASSSDALCG